MAIPLEFDELTDIELVQKGELLTKQSKSNEAGLSTSSKVVDVAKLIVAISTITVASAPVQQIPIQALSGTELMGLIEVAGSILIGDQKIPLDLESKSSQPDIMKVIGGIEGDRAMERERFIKSIDKIYDSVYNSGLLIFGLSIIGLMILLFFEGVPKEISFVGIPLSLVSIIGLFGFRSLFRRFFS